MQEATICNEAYFRFQKDTACTRLECYRQLYKLCQHNPAPRYEGPNLIFGQAGRRSLSHGWLCTSQKRGTSSQILARRYTQINTLQSYGFCHKQIKKQQTSIRCNNTHWVHPNCTHIKQREYKPDWRCTIYTPTQIVTTTPSTDNTVIRNSPSQTNHHPTTHRKQSTIGQKHSRTSNQHKRHQKQNRGT